MAAIPYLGQRGFPAAAQPRQGNDAAISSDARYGGPRATVVTTPDKLGLRARTPATQNNRLIARDRHVIQRTGRTATSSLPNVLNPGFPNPNADGPPPPAWEMVNRTVSWQIGASDTRNLDNDAPHAYVDAGGRRFPLGPQDGTSVRRYGGTPGLIHPYGARGRVIGPPPKVVALPGGPFPVGIVVEPGSPQDEAPVISGGAPHGLHSPTLPSTVITRARYRSTPQMRPGRQDRPLNNRSAGQSYTQTVVHLDGSGGGPLPRMDGGRQPGMNARWST